MKLNIPATGAKPLGKNSSEPTSLSTAPFRSPASGTRPGPPPQSPTLANVSQIISKVSFLIFLSSGSKCVTPLLPPTRHNLIPVWDKNNPPGRLDIRVVPSDQCYLRAWLHVNIQMFCRRSAQPTDIRLQSGHLQSDLPPRKSVLHPNLADLCCKYYTSLKKCIL